MSSEENSADKKLKRVSFLEYAPHTPGVYIMRNSGKIIYIGKAKNIFRRVSSYFTGDKDVKTAHLVSKIEDIEYIITKTEYEALILENNLIKKWKPKYNICLKDGKTYPVIKITNEPFPSVCKTRYIYDDGASYFGPFPSVEVIERYLEFIKKRFPLRKCRGELKARKDPCLYYHLGRCMAPCCGRADQKEYNSYIKKIKTLLSGNTKPLISEITKKMTESSKALDFEKAAEYRDFISAVNALVSEQKVQDFNAESRDYIAAENDGDYTAFVVLQMRGGKLAGKSVFISCVANMEDASTQFFIQYYSQFRNISMGMTALPGEIFTNIMPETDYLKQYFSEMEFPDIPVLLPSSSRDVSMVNMASENCRMELYKKNRMVSMEDALLELQQKLDLPVLPKRIEGFDICHMGGTKTVASMVSFFNGKPDKSQYRSFHIKSLPDGSIDDYQSMREVIARRYTKVSNEELKEPDLILVDGGKGQLNAALHILKILEMEHIAIAGLAEKNEEIFLPGKKEPVVLPRTSQALKILQNVRDESHRFANRFNQQLLKKDLNLSELEKIPGIGEVRSKRLLETFGSLDSIVSASPYKISEVAGIPLEAAEKCIEYLRK
ncbi:MAG: excinuclease ABC subunit UvrC [Spirochaetia bacterium]|nr:excinuclease ABC subunit UvrC [Spirochaetia bacterium]